MSVLRNIARRGMAGVRVSHKSHLYTFSLTVLLRIPFAKDLHTACSLDQVLLCLKQGVYQSHWLTNSLYLISTWTCLELILCKSLSTVGDYTLALTCYRDLASTLCLVLGLGTMDTSVWNSTTTLRLLRMRTASRVPTLMSSFGAMPRLEEPIYALPMLFSSQTPLWVLHLAVSHANCL